MAQGWERKRPPPLFSLDDSPLKWWMIDDEVWGGAMDRWRVGDAAEWMQQIAMKQDIWYRTEERCWIRAHLMLLTHRAIRLFLESVWRPTSENKCLVWEVIACVCVCVCVPGGLAPCDYVRVVWDMCKYCMCESGWRVRYGHNRWIRNVSQRVTKKQGRWGISTFFP